MMMKQNRSNCALTHRAFTLVEMMVVVVIIAIAAALVIPQFASSSVMNAQAAARLIVSDLSYAQNDAVSHQATRKVVFDVANETYQLTDNNDVPLTAAWMGGNYVVDFQNGNLDGIDITSAAFGGNNWVSFDDLGAPSSGGQIEINCSGFKYQITVTAFTGRVSVEQITGGE